MRVILLLAVAVVAWPSFAGLHTLDKAIRAVKAGQVNKALLVYKTKDRGMALQSQGWRTYLSPLGEVSLPLFQKISALPAHEMQTLNQKTGRDANELKDYFTRRYSVDLSDAAAVEILREMYADSNVEFAYFEPRFEDAVWQKPSGVAPVISSQAGGLENFESRQFHLNPAPEGVDARYGWTIPGGTGQGIRIIDVETGWFTHHLEFGAAFYDNGKNGQRDHGTAVWGAVAAKNDGRGIVGIAYDVAWGIAGNGADAGLDNYATAIAAVIENAVLNLEAGDMLIIEQHAQLVDGYGPIEYFEPVFKILQLATAKGIHCVAAGGNGGENLDHPKFQGAFDISKRDSGCMLVGAAEPPTGSQARERSYFSSYGARIDAYGYGNGVVTSGYGDMFSGEIDGKLASYTADFSGTSSATPIVAGAVASVLGMAKAKGVVITPAQMREALRATGTPQGGAATERIGNLPDLRQLVTRFFGPQL